MISSGAPVAARKSRLLRALGVGAAVSLGCWVGAQLWPRWPSTRPRHPATSTLAPSVAKVSAPLPAPEKQVSILGTEASLSDRPLKLVLVATRPGRTLGDSTASLGTDARNPQTYGGGAVLSNGARITDVQSDHVVLSQDGKRSTLRIDPGAGGVVPRRP
jgi:hypothetical protein